MAPLVKLTGLLLCAGHAYAAYYGGIGVGPFLNSDDGATCPPGTDIGSITAFCCPTGTVFDTAQDSALLCCPSSADCTNDLLNSGVQCADPSMTLFKSGGSLICCPAGYYVNDERYCVNTGDHVLYTSTAQSGSLTPDGSSPTGAAGGSAMPSDSAATTTDDGSAATSTPDAGATDTGSGASAAQTASGTAGGAGGVTTGAGIAGSTTSSAAPKSTNLAAAASVDAGAGIVGALLAVGGMLLV